MGGTTFTKDELLGFVKASSNRQKILLALSSKDMTPLEIAKVTDLALSNVTKILGDLRKKNLVQCKTPKLRKGRIYTLTDLGREIISFMPK
ncbi:MAG: winged helix-turn-helix domain-containing protein [Candidatus Aenigmatarchaeota archaeon]